MENDFYHFKLPPLIVTIYITHLRNLRNGSYDNDWGINFGGLRDLYTHSCFKNDSSQGSCESVH